MSIYINGNPRSLSLYIYIYIYIYILLAFMNHLKNGCIIFVFIILNYLLLFSKIALYTYGSSIAVSYIAFNSSSVNSTTVFFLSVLSPSSDSEVHHDRGGLEPRGRRFREEDVTFDGVFVLGRPLFGVMGGGIAVLTFGVGLVRVILRP